MQGRITSKAIDQLLLTEQKKWIKFFKRESGYDAEMINRFGSLVEYARVVTGEKKGRVNPLLLPGERETAKQFLIEVYKFFGVAAKIPTSPKALRKALDAPLSQTELEGEAPLKIHSSNISIHHALERSATAKPSLHLERKDSESPPSSPESSVSPLSPTESKNDDRKSDAAKMLRNKYYFKLNRSLTGAKTKIQLAPVDADVTETLKPM